MRKSGVGHVHAVDAVVGALAHFEVQQLLGDGLPPQYFAALGRDVAAEGGGVTFDAKNGSEFRCGGART